MADDGTGKPELLRATSDMLMIAIAEVGAREQRKRGVLPADPRFDTLAREVREAAEVVLELSRQEEVTANQTSGDPSSVGMPSIAATPPAKELASILAEWRAVEKHLAAATPGSDEAASLLAEFERLRDRYAASLKDRQRRS